MAENWISVDLGAGISAFFTTRRGGFSDGAFQALNLSTSSEDDLAAVQRNRSLVSEKIGAPLMGMHQVHGGDVARVSALDLDLPAPRVDGMLTTDPSIALTVLVADCVPVLMADAEAEVVAAVHAGRRGVDEEVVRATIIKMRQEGARPDRIRAAIGPSICGNCYEVPEEMRAEMAESIPVSAARTSWGTPALDLRAAVESQMRQQGLKHVHRVEVCTYENPSFYSYRANPVTGRFAGVIRLNK